MPCATAQGRRLQLAESPDRPNSCTCRGVELSNVGWSRKVPLSHKRYYSVLAALGLIKNDRNDDDMETAAVIASAKQSGL